MGMIDEARSIPEIVAASLDRGDTAVAAVAERISAYGPRVLVTVARGSSDHAADYFGRLAAIRLGLLPVSLPPSLITVDGARPDLKAALVVAVSQSGRSPDLIAPIRVARDAGALTVALVNDTDSPLAGAADLVLPVDAGAETAVAATKSYVLSLVQSARLVALLAGDEALADAVRGLPPILVRALDADWTGIVPVLAPARAPFVIGRGFGLTVAREIALKLKEICGLSAEAVSGAEIMHGPKALIGPDDPVVALAPDDRARGAMETAIAALGRLSRRVVVLGRPAAGAGLALPVPSCPAPELACIAAATAAYPAMAALARARGLSPDAPRHLDKVTETL